MDRRTSPNLHPETNAKNFFYVYVINLSTGVISYGFFHDLKYRECVLIHIERMSTSFMVPIVNEAIKMLALSLLPNHRIKSLIFLLFTSISFVHVFIYSAFIRPFILPFCHATSCTWKWRNILNLNPDEVILW